MQRELLPTGIQDFRTIREEGLYYVDKTQLIHEMVREGRHYFLSRPRRFGKSLLVDTLRQLFSGNESLFRGLLIHEQWDWTDTYPVIRLSFGGKTNESGNLEANVHKQLEIIGRNFDLDLGPPTEAGPDRFMDLIDQLHRNTGRQVVVLVDEYDKPILDTLNKPDIAESNREYLRGFYGVIKDSAEHVRFVFVTGISMFTKVSLFSGLNNLKNITLNPRYATICGFTDGDLDTVFASEFEGLDRNEVRRWYNGYNWLGEEKLYNPFDILLLLDERVFEAHWFETATPEMLFRQIIQEKINPMKLENMVADTQLLSKFDVSDIDLRALMFQTGYLTITRMDVRRNQRRFQLGYPNHEVRESMAKGLLEYVTRRRVEAEAYGETLASLLSAHDFDGFREKLKTYLSSIPHQWYDVSEIERFEAHYASMLLMCLRSIGLEVIVEDASSLGRADMSLFHEGEIFIFEFKMAGKGESFESALDRGMTQIHERGYADKYRDRNEPIHLIAVVFDEKQRNLVGLRADRI